MKYVVMIAPGNYGAEREFPLAVFENELEAQKFVEEIENKAETEKFPANNVMEVGWDIRIEKLDDTQYYVSYVFSYKIEDNKPVLYKTSSYVNTYEGDESLMKNGKFIKRSNEVICYVELDSKEANYDVAKSIANTIASQYV